jgi:hypothetical protein
MNLGWVKVPLLGKLMIWWVGLVFLTFDVCLNVSVGTAVFVQLPTMQTLTLSKRMAHNIATEALTWRGKLAQAIVDYLLLPFTKSY